MTGANVNPQWIEAAAGIIAAYAALFAGIYAVVTRPIVRRMDGVIARLTRIENKLERLDSHAERITRVEAVRWK